ncbi:unnamed protein product [Urochloa humidicola]
MHAPSVRFESKPAPLGLGFGSPPILASRHPRDDVPTPRRQTAPSPLTKQIDRYARPWAHMGIPLEPRCGGGASPACRQWPSGVAGKQEPDAEAIVGCRTPARRPQQEGVGDDDAARVLVCPPAPRKKRVRAAAGAQRTREFYNGADLEAFFAAHNL